MTQHQEGSLSKRVATLFSQCSNAGRWGADDELGTLNLITAAKRVEAARLVTRGESVSMASDLSLATSQLSDSLTEYAARRDSKFSAVVVDKLSLNIHGWSTHFDSVGHVFVHGVGYNGQRKEKTFDKSGLTRGAITVARHGVFTRGVLLDVTAVRGVEWLAADQYVTAQDLDRAEKNTGVRVESGDALFVYVGLAPRIAAESNSEPAKRAGLSLDAILWLRNRDVAIFGGDCIERMPSEDDELPLPLHQLGVAAMGMLLLDWAQIEDLLSVCRRIQRYEFLFTAAPLRIVGGTGSPVNPIATF